MRALLLFLAFFVATSCRHIERELYQWSFDRAVVSGLDAVEADAFARCFTPIATEVLWKIDCIGWFSNLDEVKACAFDGSQREAILNVYLRRATENCSTIVDMALRYKEQ